MEPDEWLQLTTKRIDFVVDLANLCFWAKIVFCTCLYNRVSHTLKTKINSKKLCITTYWIPNLLWKSITSLCPRSKTWLYFNKNIFSYKSDSRIASLSVTKTPQPLRIMPISQISAIMPLSHLAPTLPPPPLSLSELQLLAIMPISHHAYIAFWLMPCFCDFWGILACCSSVECSVL